MLLSVMELMRVATRAPVLSMKLLTTTVLLSARLLLIRVAGVNW